MSDKVAAQSNLSLYFPSAANSGSSNPVWVKSKAEKLAPVASLLDDLEHGWLFQCQFKVTGSGVMFICGMVFRCTGLLKPASSLDQLQQLCQPFTHTNKFLLSRFYV